VVTTGVGEQLTPGNFRMTWNIPQDAVLSLDDAKYRIEWSMLDENQQQYQFSQEFDVVDVQLLEESEHPEQVNMGLKGKDFRATFWSKIEPYALNLTVYRGTDDQNPIVGPVTLEAEQIEGPNDHGIWKQYGYTIKGEDLSVACNYTLIWGVQEYETSQFTYEHDTLHILPIALLQYIKPLRMVIDKLQKQMNKIQAYQDSDVVEYLTRGVEMVNSYHPVTYYTPTNLPKQLYTGWIICSAWYALNAQHILETELQYSFSGQADTFEFDHTAGLSEALSRMWEYMGTVFAQAKTQLFRTQHRVGSVATRMQSYRRGFSQNIVFKLSDGNIVNGPQLGNFVAFFSLSG
jgi:hypothetical protein